ncbi:hypothetical protein OAJ21_02390 [Pelagibacteraceae bacterium]|nr:hypothetical protein [Pelagibacteraceae bacterium]
MYNKYNLTVLSFFFLILLFPFLGIFSKINYDIQEIRVFLKNSYTQRIIFFSFYQAFLSAFISCVLAIPFALALNRHKDHILIQYIISICGFSFVIPSILIVFSVVKIFGFNGVLNKYFSFYELLSIKSIYGLKAILIAHVLLNTPFATRLFVQNLNNIPKNYYEISKSINLNFLGNIFKLELPIIKQSLFAVFSIIFSLCFLSFAIVMALGGGPKNSTLEVAIFQYALFDLNFNKAILLSFIQISICITFVFIGFYKFKGSNFFEVGAIKYKHPHKNKSIIKFIDYLLILFFIFVLFSPIFIIYTEFLKSIFLKVNLTNAFIHAFKNSILISLLTGVIVSIFGLLISYLVVINHKNFFLQQLLLLTSSMILIISPIIFSLGYFIFFQPIINYSYIKVFLVILINVIFLLPFAILIFFNNLKNLYLSFNDFRKTYRIDLISYIKIIFPLLRKNFLYVFSFSTVITFGDFTIISFFRSENFETLPSYLFKLISTYQFNEASFVAGTILFFSMIIYFIIDNFNYHGRPDITT